MNNDKIICGKKNGGLQNFETFENVQTESQIDFVNYFAILNYATRPMIFWDTTKTKTDQQILTVGLARLLFAREIPVSIAIKFLIPDQNGFAFNKNYADPFRIHHAELTKICDEWGNICEANC